MEALWQLAITGDPQLGGKLGDVVLASPDIGVDVFKAQLARYRKPKRPFLIMLPGDDRALQVSRIAGDRPRVGDYRDPADLAKLGVAVVDLSQVTGDRLGHTKFAENPVMIRLIGEDLKREEELP
jgi:esterase/lipase superfamily enzyme